MKRETLRICILGWGKIPISLSLEPGNQARLAAFYVENCRVIIQQAELVWSPCIKITGHRFFNIFWLPIAILFELQKAFIIPSDIITINGTTPAITMTFYRFVNSATTISGFFREPSIVNETLVHEDSCHAREVVAFREVGVIIPIKEYCSHFFPFMVMSRLRSFAALVVRRLMKSMAVAPDWPGEPPIRISGVHFCLPNSSKAIPMTFS